MSAVAAPSQHRLSRREREAVEELLWRRVTADPLVFLGAVKTLDEHAGPDETALKPFPICAICSTDERANAETVVLGEVPRQLSVCRAHGRVHKPYFRPLTRTWQHEEINLIEKSRQMLVSHWAVDVHVHLAMTQPGALIAFQSLSREKSCELLERASICYRSLPLELQRFGPLSDAPKATARRIEDELSFVHVIEGRKIPSRIKAIPSGPHMFRMFTFTAVLMDECSFFERDEDFEESYTAALAGIKGGGKLTAVSTVNDAGRYFYRLCRGLV